MAPSTRSELKWEQMAANIIASVEQFEATGKWQRPWKLVKHRNHFTGTVYGGINTFLLMMTPFDCPLWGTFDNWKKAGYKVKKGATAEIVWSKSVIEKQNDDGTTYATYSNSRPIYIFNGEQIEDFPWEPETSIELDPQINSVLLAKNPKIITENAAMAYYDHKRDAINLPPVNRFLSESTYFATLAHELIHWCGAESRLNRESLLKYEEAQNRPYEELVAEIGASILGMDLGFNTDIQPNHFEYIKGWMTLLREQKDSLKSATMDAIKAVNFVR